MKRTAFVFVGLLAGLSWAGIGCSEEVSHTESDKPRLLGGHVHEESTTYKNPDGTYSTEKSKMKTP